FLEARFTAALGVLHADFLQPLAAQVVTATDDGNTLPGKVFALAIRRQAGDPQVNAQRAGVWRCFLRRFAALRAVPIVDTCSPDQIGPANVPGGAFHGVERDPVQAHQAIGARVVANAATRPEGETRLTLLGLYRPDRFQRLGSGAYRQLRTQREVNAGLPIYP